MPNMASLAGLRVSDYPRGGVMAPHSHDEISFIVVAGGSYVERIGGVETEHRRGSMLLYPAGAMHSQRFGARGARKIVFSPEPGCLDYLREHGVPLDVPRQLRGDEIARLAERVIAEWESADVFSTLTIQGLVFELAAAFGRTADALAAPAAGGVRAWLRKVRDALDDAPDDSVSLATIAQLAQRHPAHVAREFRRYFGTSIGEYRRQRRLARARHMLRGESSVSEIAYACGFASHSHFTRAFKAAYGVPPSRVRGDSGRS
jgi:AraC family transcriptional regulator